MAWPLLDDASFFRPAYACYSNFIGSSSRIYPFPFPFPSLPLPQIPPTQIAGAPVMREGRAHPACLPPAPAASPNHACPLPILRDLLPLPSFASTCPLRPFPSLPFPLHQCPGRFLGITGWDPSLCRSNRLQVHILRFSFTNNVGIL